MGRVLLLSCLAACTAAPDPVERPAPAAPSTTPTAADSGSLPHTGDTAAPAVTFDCATVTTLAPSVRKLPGVKGYHDLAFTPGGLAIGSDGGNTQLVQSDYAGQSSVFVPGAGLIEQMAWLPDGDLAAASDTRGIVRIAPNGAVTVINGNIRAYGLVLGPDDQLYAADEQQVLRVDPNSGKATVVLAAGALQAGAPRVIAFGLGDTRLFIGTYLGTAGRIYAVDLDERFDPVGDPWVFATGVGYGTYHDAIGVDLCGYLYVPDYDTATLYRVSPAGEVEPLLEAEGLQHRSYVHGVEWGNGVGGWREDALYLPLPYDGNAVLEAVIGVPSRDWAGGVAVGLP